MTPRIRRRPCPPRVGILIVSLVCASPACRSAGPGPGSPDPDLPAREARDVTASFHLPDDLEVTLWAESPLFFNPTNIDVDARGRVWVAEAVNYRDFNRVEGYGYRAGGDRVVILEDTDGDGAADSSRVFVQDPDLRAPLGVSVIGDQVVVSSSPSVIVYTDRDGDDRPDSKEVFLTGFGGVDHDHGLHVAVAGPDGAWYLSAGNQGPHMVTDRAGWSLRSGSVENGGSPYAKGNTPGRVSDDGRVWTGGLLLRVQPDGTGLRVLAHNMRNSYETAVDSYGNLWQNDNDDQVVASRTTWVMESADMGYFGGGGARRWQADRRPGQDVFTAHWHQEDPGVLPAGDRSGAGAPAGVAVYEDDLLGPAYRGMVLSADAGRNVVFGYRTAPRGAGFQLDRFDLISSLAESTADYVWNETVRDERKWFRPSDVAVGTDGALYVADWYDPVVGGHQMREKQARGRIYRIAPKGRALRAPRIDLSTTAGQVQALLSPAVNVRNAGFVRLQQGGARSLAAVRALLGRENPYHRARAVWLLARLGPSGVSEVRSLLRHPDPELRVTALRALRSVQPDVVAEVRTLVRDPSPAVRREAALALRDLPLERTVELLIALAEGYDGEDRWYLEALGAAAQGKEEALYPLLRQRFGASDATAWDARFAGLAWRLHPRAAVPDLAARAGSARVPAAERERALVALAFVDHPDAAQSVATLTNSTLPDVAERAAWWLAFRQGNQWHGYAVRGARQPPAPATATASPEMMRLYSAVRAAETPIERRVDAAVRLAEDPLGGALLVAALAEGHASQNVRNAIGGVLSRHADRPVRVAAEQFLGAGGAMRREPVAALTGDARRGEGVFNASCAACHRMGEVGGEVGPSLAGIGARLGRAELLEAVVEPSRAIAHNYDSSVLVTRRGAVLFGLLLSDGPVVTFRDARGRRVDVPREQVESIRPLRVSLMPRPRELGLSEQEVADVAEFLLRQR